MHLHNSCVITYIWFPLPSRCESRQRSTSRIWLHALHIIYTQTHKDKGFTIFTAWKKAFIHFLHWSP